MEQVKGLDEPIVCSAIVSFICTLDAGLGLPPDPSLVQQVSSMGGVAMSGMPNTGSSSSSTSSANNDTQPGMAPSLTPGQATQAPDPESKTIVGQEEPAPTTTADDPVVEETQVSHKRGKGKKKSVLSFITSAPAEEVVEAKAEAKTESKTTSQPNHAIITAALQTSSQSSSAPWIRTDKLTMVPKYLQTLWSMHLLQAMHHLLQELQTHLDMDSHNVTSTAALTSPGANAIMASIETLLDSRDELLQRA